MGMDSNLVPKVSPLPGKERETLETSLYGLKELGLKIGIIVEARSEKGTKK